MPKLTYLVLALILFAIIVHLGGDVEAVAQVRKPPP